VLFFQLSPQASIVPHLQLVPKSANIWTPSAKFKFFPTVLLGNNEIKGQFWASALVSLNILSVCLKHKLWWSPVWPASTHLNVITRQLSHANTDLSTEVLHNSPSNPSQKGFLYQSSDFISATHAQANSPHCINASSFFLIWSSFSYHFCLHHYILVHIFTHMQIYFHTWESNTTSCCGKRWLSRQLQLQQTDSMLWNPASVTYLLCVLDTLFILLES
jgi:hypothetical protein